MFDDRHPGQIHVPKLFHIANLLVVCDALI
jgi:hypothetical protein